MAIDNSISSTASSTAAQNIAPSEINILIKSNRNYPQGFNAMGGPYNGNDNANAKQEYRYNFTAYIFNTQNSILTIQVKGIGSSTFTTLSTPFAGNTIGSVAQTLNTLNIGIFNTYTSLGQTYVSTYNDTNVFGDLTIFSEIVSVQQGITTQSSSPIQRSLDNNIYNGDNNMNNYDYNNYHHSHNVKQSIVNKYDNDDDDEYDDWNDDSTMNEHMNYNNNNNSHQSNTNKNSNQQFNSKGKNIVSNSPPNKVYYI